MSFAGLGHVCIVKKTVTLGLKMLLKDLKYKLWFVTNNIDLHFIERDTNIRVLGLHRKRSFCYMVFLTNTEKLQCNPKQTKTLSQSSK